MDIFFVEVIGIVKHHHFHGFDVVSTVMPDEGEIEFINVDKLKGKKRRGREGEGKGKENERKGKGRRKEDGLRERKEGKRNKKMKPEGG